MDLEFLQFWMFDRKRNSNFMETSGGIGLISSRLMVEGLYGIKALLWLLEEDLMAIYFLHFQTILLLMITNYIFMI